MQIRCPSCAKSLQVDESSAGKRVKCPCGTILQVPSGGGAKAAPKPTAPAAAAKPATSAPRPAAPGKPLAPAANRAGATSGPGAAARTSQPAPKSGPGAFGVEHSEMASLFGELTESDMVVKGPSTAPAKTKKTKDPLAGYATGAPPASSKPRASSQGSPFENVGNGQRPVGVTILAVLSLLGAIFGAIAVVLALVGATVIQSVQVNLAGVGMLAGLMVGGLALLVVLYFAMGIGLLKGQRWGWWAAVFAYSHVIWERLFLMIASIIEPNTLGIVKGAIGVLVTPLFIVYLCRLRVRSFCNIADAHVGKSLGIAFGITLVVVIACDAAMHFARPNVPTPAAPTAPAVSGATPSVPAP
jgi:hypothetical protein